MAFLTIFGTWGSAGQSDCLRCVRGEGMEVCERASSNFAVGLASLSVKAALHSELELVGDREGACNFEFDPEGGVTGVEATWVPGAGDGSF